MAVIGATQLEPVNVLGQYVQGLEAGRSARAQRAKEAQATQLQNMLMGATPEQLQSPEFINRLAVMPEGATIAKTLSESAAASRTARKEDLDIAIKQGEVIAREAGAFLDDPTSLSKATIDAWAQGAVQRGLLSQEAYARFQQLPDDPNVLGPAMQRLQTQGLSLADQLRYQRVTPEAMLPYEQALSPEVEEQKIRIAGAGASRTTIQMPPAGKKFSETLGEKAALRLDDFRTKAESARRTLSLSERLRPLLNDPAFISGTLAQKRTAAARALGMDVAATEAFFAGIGDQVAERITQFGAGTGLSDADRQYAKQIVGGEETFSKEGIEKIMRINDETARDVIRNYGTERERLAKKEPEVLDYYPELSAEIALSAQDQDALNWANANPNDPRSTKIKQRLGVQ